MAEQAQTTVTRLLVKFEGGDRSALDELFPLLYEELLALARGQRRRWSGDDTVDTTALVHELYLRLADQTRVGVQGRAHFCALAAKAMRQILSNYGRSRRAQKRGGPAIQLPFEDAKLLLDPDPWTVDARIDLVLMLDDAMRGLEQVDPRSARVVECRFYGGMSVSDTATALGISPRTVKRDWAFAQAWLYRELNR